ncbi:FadR/GntR family transcriptional regulator [Streptomyces iranensis]|uniref:DNA-binding FadR family transcriptional regulator n=2 Tax=Streptomyces iranensis TaxID=576784 RepID=A0ABS4MUI8_9ACTN|nr:FCD domain-containing protein [Streptomyces iranensis]MBP2063396.1 DNA-binding FadR family transcriptional regulator [Streptomyces iranensis]
MRQFAPVRSRRVTHDVMAQFLDRLKSGELREGDALLGERVLAAQMDVSRPTISHVIGRLTEAGILKSGQGRNGNAEVISIWIPEWLEEDTNEVAGDLSPETIFRILEARKAVEPRVAQLAALRATDQIYDEMARSIQLLRKQRDDVTRAQQAEQLFHRIMWRAAGNPSLERMMKGLETEIAPIHELMLRTPEDYEAGVELHEATLAAMMRGDPEEIEREMVRHLTHFEMIVEDSLQRTPRRRLPSFLMPLAGENRPAR